LSRKKPCKGCDEKEQFVYRKGKIPMRFVRAGRKVGLHNYKDGEVYWMYPRHAAYAWWEPVGVPEMPVVKPATQKESVFDPDGATITFKRTISEDSSGPATIGDSGFTLTPSGMLSGSLRSAQEEAEVIISEKPEPVKVEEKRDLGFPDGKKPSRRWRKAELLAFIRHNGGVATKQMKKDLLFTLASSLA